MREVVPMLSSLQVSIPSDDVYASSVVGRLCDAVGDPVHGAGVAAVGHEVPDLFDLSFRADVDEAHAVLEECRGDESSVVAVAGVRLVPVRRASPDVRGRTAVDVGAVVHAVL